MEEDNFEWRGVDYGDDGAAGSENKAGSPGLRGKTSKVAIIYNSDAGFKIHRATLCFFPNI